MIMIGFFFYVAIVNTQWLWHFWQLAIQVANHPILLREETGTHTVHLAFVHGRLLTFTFDTQKNGIKGKHIGHRCSTSATLCPILAVPHWVAHLNSQKAKPHQPLCSYYHTASKIYCYLASQDIMQVLCASAIHHPHSVSTPLLWSAAHYIPAVLCHFSHVGLISYSSSLLAAGVLTQRSTLCRSSPTSSCQDCQNSCWLVAIPSS